MSTSRFLKKSHRLFSGVGYYGNFLGLPIQVGDLFQVDGTDHILLGNLSKLSPGIDIKNNITSSNEANFKFTSGREFEISFGANVDLKLGKGEVLIDFKSKSSAFVSLNNARFEVLSLGMVEDQIKQYWQERKYDRPGNRSQYILVSSVVQADSGTVIFSQERNNKVVLKASTDEEIKSIKAMGSGNFEYVSNTKATLEIISTENIQPMYRALWIRANGKFDVVK